MNFKYILSIMIIVGTLVFSGCCKWCCKSDSCSTKNDSVVSQEYLVDSDEDDSLLEELHEIDQINEK